MKDKILSVICSVLFLFSLNSFSAVFPVELNTVATQCPTVPSYKDATFCHEFKTTVLCNCHNAITNPKLWPTYCKNVTKIYNEMIGEYGSIRGGCTHEWGTNDPTDLKECRNQWHCAMFGIAYTPGAVCSGNPAPNQACKNIV